MEEEGGERRGQEVDGEERVVERTRGRRRSGMERERLKEQEDEGGEGGKRMRRQEMECKGQMT